MIDKKIIDLLNRDSSVVDIKLDLVIRITNFNKIIDKLGCDYQQLSAKEFHEIEGTRERYGVTYIKHCRKRLIDLDWILENNKKFEKLNQKKMFQLVQLKDKLS